MEQPSPWYGLAVVRELHAEGELVAAGRVDVVHFGLERGAQASMMRVLVMIQDDVLVHGIKVHSALPYFASSSSIPSTRKNLRA